MRHSSKLSLAVLALSLIGTAAQAQSNNAAVTATASVQQPINVVAGQSLNFGNVFPGVNKSILATDLTNAGRWDVTGQASTPVTLSVVTPAALNCATPGTCGASTLPIGAFTGQYNTTNAAGGSSFTVATGANPSLSGSGQLFVWVGGQVTPAVNQAAGTYTNTITLTVVY